ncbi:MAG: hypothetical protein M9927_07760 [Anaerolineae bacterium]|nr:hypothetical protein [Anaerolineae bacterium]
MLFVTQTTQQGFGRGLVKDAVGDEPFLLMLGDHIYRAPGHVLRPPISMSTSSTSAWDVRRARASRHRQPARWSGFD